MTQGPLHVSVIIPVFQGEQYVGQAVQSVLDQTRPPDEIVVVDDGCTDASMEVVHSVAQRAGDSCVPLRIIHRDNGGPAAARNSGLGAACHQIIAFHDADDVAHPRWLEISVRRLETQPDSIGVVGRQVVLLEPGAPMPAWMAQPPASTPDVEPYEVRHHLMNMVVRRSGLDEVGQFDETMPFGEDTDLVMRMSEAGLLIDFIDDVVVSRRVHQGNLTHDAEGLRRAQFEVLARRIRRRAGNR